MAYDENIYAKIVSGELTEAEVNQLKASGEWDEIQQILEVSSTLELPSLDKEGSYERLKNKRDSKPKSTIIRRLRPAIMGLAALLVCVLAYIFLFDTNETIETGNGQLLSVNLPDNSSVDLNYGSKLTYDKKFNERTNRTVQLEGEALFQVEKGNRFTVRTTAGQVEVLGTVFNVKVRDNIFEVECYEGSVGVRVGQTIEVLTQGEAVRLEDVLTQPYIIENSSPNWKNGFSRFYDQSVQDVFAELERVYNVKVEMPSINTPFNGSFRHDDLNDALESICLPLSLTFKIENENKVIIQD